MIDQLSYVWLNTEHQICEQVFSIGYASFDYSYSPISPSLQFNAHLQIDLRRQTERDSDGYAGIDYGYEGASALASSSLNVTGSGVGQVTDSSGQQNTNIQGAAYRLGCDLVTFAVRLNSCNEIEVLSSSGALLRNGTVTIKCPVIGTNFEFETVRLDIDPSMVDINPPGAPDGLLDCKDVLAFQEELDLNPTNPFSSYPQAVRTAFDLDGDGQIDQADFDIFASLFGSNLKGDGNNNCIVDACDVNIIREIIQLDSNNIVLSTEPNFDPDLDMNDDGQIDIVDVGDYLTPNTVIGTAWSSGNYLAGDCTGDYVVSLADFSVVLSNYGLSSAGMLPGDQVLFGDVNQDGTVSLADYSVVLSNMDAGLPDGDLGTECE